MIQPLIPVFNWLLSFYNFMPYSIRAFVELAIALFALSSLFQLVYHVR